MHSLFTVPSFLSLVLTCDGFTDLKSIRCIPTSKTVCFDQHYIIVNSICSNVDINWYEFAFQGAVAGGCRALSRGLTFPFDTLKTLSQTSTTTASATASKVEDKQQSIEEIDNVSKLKLLVSKEYFRGILPAVLSAIPANAVFFVVYKYLQTIAASDCVLHSLSIENVDFYHKTSVLFLERLIFSAVATLPQNAIKIPAELIKQRAQIQPNISTTMIVKRILEPSGIKGLYQGGGAQLIREIPYNAIQMATFQFFKETLLNNNDYIHDFNFGLSTATISGILGLFAAAIAAILTQPADVIKTRLMTQIDEKIKFQENDEIMNIGIIKTIKMILEEQTWKGLFVGLVPRLILVSLGGMVYFWAAEVATEIFEVSLAK
jgi:hypothetical protein